MLIVFGIMFGAANLPHRDSYAQREDALKLSLFIAPPTVPADGDSYRIVYVAVLDSHNNPAAVGGKLEVTLSSSATNIGFVDGITFIESGNYYSVATFYSTEAAGTTTISATASGFVSAQATVTTVKSSDRNPARLHVVALPSPALPQQNWEGLVIVQLLDSFGSPVVAREDVTVTLASSNNKLVDVDDSATIPKDQIHTRAKFHTTFASGQSTITASADGLTSGTYVISVGETVASTLKVYPLPTTILASRTAESLVAIQLEDHRGRPVRASEDIIVSLFSSDDRIIAPKEQTTVIGKGQSLSAATIIAGGNEGTAAITPIATGFLSVPENVKAVKPATGFDERKIMIFTVPPNPDPIATDKSLIAIQILGGNNAPVAVAAATKVQLSSSNTSFGVLQEELTIMPGNSLGVVNMNLAGFPGTTTITASAANFQSNQLQLVVRGDVRSALELLPTSLNIPAYGAPYPAFLVVLNNDNVPLKAPTNVNVFLTSLTPELAHVPSVVTIPKGSSFAVVNITPTGIAGTVTVTATAEGFQQSVRSITLSEFNPSAIAIFTPFPTLVPSSSQGEELVIVQLQNSRGEPERNLISDTNIALSLFPRTIGTVQQNLVIPIGANFAAGKIFLNPVQDIGTITGTAEGFKLVFTKFKTIALPVDVKLTIEPPVIGINQTATLTVKVTSHGKPLPDARIKWIYDEHAAVLMSASETTNAEGEGKAIYISKNDVPQQINAVVTKPGYVSMESRLVLSPGGMPGRFAPFSTEVISIILVSAIVAEGLLVYHFYQKKKPIR
jgi:hypothetical protein